MADAAPFIIGAVIAGSAGAQMYEEHEAMEEQQQAQEIWESLNHQQQEKIIIALSRLVSKYVCPEKTNQTREANHDG